MWGSNLPVARVSPEKSWPGDVVPEMGQMILPHVKRFTWLWNLCSIVNGDEVASLASA